MVVIGTVTPMVVDQEKKSHARDLMRTMATEKTHASYDDTRDGEKELLFPVILVGFSSITFSSLHQQG
jgi:hypothetical protein